MQSFIGHKYCAASQFLLQNLGAQICDIRQGKAKESLGG